MNLRVPSAERPLVAGLDDTWPTLFDAATDVVAWLDRDLRYRYINRAIESATGRPPLDFIGHTNEELGTAPSEAALWRARLSDVVESGQPALFEFEFDTPEGRRRFQSTAAPILDEAGAVESVVVISRDITDTRALRLLEGAVHHLPTAVALVEAPTGRLLLRNAQATEIFRVESTPLTGIAGYSRFTGFHADGREYQAQEWPLSRSILTGEIIVGEVARIRRGDGTHGFIRMTSAPVRDGSGTIIAGLVTFDDITEQATAEQQQHFLASAAALLGESLDAAAVLQKLARLAVPVVADWCVIHTVGAGGIELVALEHADAGLRAAAREMARRYPVVSDRDSAVQRVLAEGRSELHAQITDEELRAAAIDEEHLAYLRTVGCRSLIVVPIAGRSGVNGSITFVTADSGRSYSERDLAFAEDLAKRAGLALENARLYEQERAARHAAERAAERLSRLHAFTAALAAAASPNEVTTALVTEGRTAIGADVGFVWLLDERRETFELSASDGTAAGEGGLARFSIQESIPLVDAVRTGRPVLIESAEAADRYERIAQNNVRFATLVAIPLVFGDRALGGFSFSFRRPRRFDHDDIAFLVGLGGQTSQAIDRARLFQAEQDARAEAQTLHRVGTAVASTLDLKAILQAVTDETTAITGAEFGAFFYNGITQDGEAFLLYTLSGAPAEAFATFPAPRATALFGPTFRGEGTIRLDDVRADSRYGKSAPHHGMPPGHLPVCSYLAVPVRLRSGEVIGGLFFGHSQAARFTARHEHLVEAIAAQASIGIDNARLFDQARAAQLAQSRRAEELRLAEERLRLAVDGANVGLWNYDFTSDALFWDAHIRQQFGVGDDDPMTVDGFYNLVHGEDREFLKTAFTRATEGREVYDVEYRIGSASSPRWIRSLAKASYRPDGSAYRMDGITLDITDRKGAETERAAMLEREQAARSETEAALKTRDDFLAAASHELRNPLNALQLQLVGLRRAAQRDPLSLATPAMTSRLDRTEDQISRLVRLVDTLLDVSRIKSGRLDVEYADVDLVAVAKDVMQQLEPIADGVVIRVTSTERIVGKWDPLRIEQVLVNLLSNALKYGDGKPVDLAMTLDGDCARIAVTDRGIGISSDMQQRLFARFERLTPDHRRGGFGLGLWITRQIVNAFGGTIDVLSDIGKGSTFQVELPIEPHACDSQSPNHATHKSARRRNSDR